jgi:hypothetical protein
VILPFLLFISPFVFLLSSLPTSLPNGIAGYGVTAAWTMTPMGPATLPLPLLLGKAAMILFPFGTPAFRMNLAGALLVASTLPLAYRIVMLTKPRSTPGPTLLDLDDERRWATLALMGIALWGLSPAFLHSGTTGIEPAIFVFFPFFVAHRFCLWRRRHLSNGRRWIHGMIFWGVTGLWLTLDWRWAVLLPALIPWKTGSPRKWIFLFSSFMGITLGVTFLLPWIILSAFQVATLDQLVHLLGSNLRHGQFPLGGYSLGAPWALLGVGVLLSISAITRGLKNLSARFPRGVPSALLLILLAESGWHFFKPTPFLSRERQTNDIFRSLPAESTLIYSNIELGGAATYEQRVRGKRRDIQLLNKNDPSSLRAPSSYLYPGPTEPIGEKDLPVGFVLQPLDFPLSDLTSPLAQVSLGRVPLLLAETQAPSPFLAQAHRRVGEAFASLQIPDQAEEEFLIALAIAPQDKTTSERLGRLLMDYGDRSRAKAALTRAFPKHHSIDQFR